MSKDILEAALQKTRDIETKEKNRMRLAEALGKVVGIAVSLALDATFVWAVAKFMIGLSLTWVGALGCVLLLWVVSTKFKISQ